MTKRLTLEARGKRKAAVAIHKKITTSLESRSYRCFQVCVIYNEVGAVVANGLMDELWEE